MILIKFKGKLLLVESYIFDLAQDGVEIINQDINLVGDDQYLKDEIELCDLTKLNGGCDV